MCGLKNGCVANPWLIGHEREVNEITEEIERLIRERNSKQERINARRRLRVRRGGATATGEAEHETVSEESRERMVARED